MDDNQRPTDDSDSNFSNDNLSGSNSDSNSDGDSDFSERTYNLYDEYLTDEDEELWHVPSITEFFITCRSRCACYTCNHAYSAIPRNKENSFEIIKN
jgi:hypothetical protein